MASIKYTSMLIEFFQIQIYDSDIDLLERMKMLSRNKINVIRTSLQSFSYILLK